MLLHGGFANIQAAHAAAEYRLDASRVGVLAGESPSALRISCVRGKRPGRDDATGRAFDTRSPRQSARRGAATGGRCVLLSSGAVVASDATMTEERAGAIIAAHELRHAVAESCEGWKLPRRLTLADHELAVRGFALAAADVGLVDVRQLARETSRALDWRKENGADRGTLPADLRALRAAAAEAKRGLPVPETTAEAAERLAAQEREQAASFKAKSKRRPLWTNANGSRKGSRYG